MAAESADTSATPPAREGFQMAVRTGYSLSSGQISQDDSYLGASLHGVLPWQVPLLVDAGAKVSKHFFLGAYLGFGFGAAGEVLGPFDCNASNASCSSFTYRLGVEVQYQFLPANRVNPWVGYGFGFESSSATNSVSGQPDITLTAKGLEFGHFMAGMDFRLNRWFGVGPFIDLSAGEFASVEARRPDGYVDTARQSGLHSWLTFGVRGVLFP
jgi:hypothetical protein